MSILDYAARAFGLQPELAPCPSPALLPLPAHGECLVLLGPSGAGKTLALNALLRATPGAREVKALTRAQLARPVLTLFEPAMPPELVLRTLARVGLADGRLWGLRAGQLSAGERRRLELALALCGLARGSLLVADEFDSHLDATTARVLARNLRRAAHGAGLRLALSTHRPETLPQLEPTRVIEIDNGLPRELPAPAYAELLEEIEVVPGRARDYARFAHWHYLGPGRPGPTCLALLARHAGRDIGIALFGWPHLLLAARAHALPAFAPARIKAEGAAALNRDVRLLQRVVVEPRWRGVGVSRLLIRAGLERLGVPHVECVAQMGAFSDFLLSAGFRHAGEVAPPATVRRLDAFLRRHGIAPAALLEPASRAACLEALPPAQARRLRSLLNQLLRARIETGFGSRRGRAGFDGEAMLRKAISRLGARPGYYLWSRSNTQ